MTRAKTIGRKVRGTAKPGRAGMSVLAVAAAVRRGESCRDVPSRAAALAASASGRRNLNRRHPCGQPD
jgi:hypothetical protein